MRTGSDDRAEHRGPATRFLATGRCAVLGLLITALCWVGGGFERGGLSTGLFVTYHDPTRGILWQRKTTLTRSDFRYQPVAPPPPAGTDLPSDMDRQNYDARLARVPKQVLPVAQWEFLAKSPPPRATVVFAGAPIPVAFDSWTAPLWAPSSKPLSLGGNWRFHLPTRVLPLGIAIDVAFWACVAWVGGWGVRAIRARSRQSRENCQRCGYDIRELPVCPECGTLAPRARSALSPVEGGATSTKRH